MTFKIDWIVFVALFALIFGWFAPLAPADPIVVLGLVGEEGRTSMCSPVAFKAYHVHWPATTWYELKFRYKNSEWEADDSINSGFPVREPDFWASYRPYDDGVYTTWECRGVALVPVDEDYTEMFTLTLKPKGNLQMQHTWWDETNPNQWWPRNPQPFDIEVLEGTINGLPADELWSGWSYTRLPECMIAN